ncbi:unnamed protein product [Rangifer tarandus platyrhynchus]|uniref:Uncharacterized protein n=1 Tax=Rangifer tarandus platyrhynchus TaxID=3082113 RepID=A0ABN8Z0F4_RANTA|nr:unnamed protein product [Rangifer tarandus platyrhynchus]
MAAAGCWGGPGPLQLGAPPRASITAETALSSSEAREDGTEGPSPFSSECPETPPACLNSTTGFQKTPWAWHTDRTQGEGAKQRDEGRTEQGGLVGGSLASGKAFLGLAPFIPPERPSL